jgi:hypothetical protein
MRMSFWSGAGAAIGIAALAVVVHGQALPALGTAESEVREQLVQSIFGGTVPFVGVAVFKAASPAQRTSLVQSSIAWAKAFTQSAAFKAAYDTVRARNRPEPPTEEPAIDSAGQRADFEKQVAEMRKNMAGQPAEVQKIVEDTIKQMRDQMDKTANDPAMAKMMRDAAGAQRTAHQEQYAKDLREYDAKHPVDAQAAVANVLQQFMATCADVDFDAKLTSSGGAMVFVNPDYEQKSSEWKMCFRAGRAPVVAARAAGQAWLKALGR